MTAVSHERAETINRLFRFVLCFVFSFFHSLLRVVRGHHCVHTARSTSAAHRCHLIITLYLANVQITLIEHIYRAVCAGGGGIGRSYLNPTITSSCSLCTGCTRRRRDTVVRDRTHFSTSDNDRDAGFNGYHELNEISV